MTNTNEDLGKKIEQLIAGHIASTRKAAQEAMERAFASSRAVPAPAAQPVRVRQSGKRRAAADLAALGERLLSLTLFRDVWLTYFRGGSGLISQIAWHGGLG